jgi:hypothetical protein
MVGLSGLEPPTSRLSGVRSDQLSYRPMERVKGIEPSSSAWKAEVLPLNYTRKKQMGRLMGIEPTNVGTTIRCVNHFATIAIIFTFKRWWLRTESNRRHMDFQSIALPTELLSQEFTASAKLRISSSAPSFTSSRTCQCAPVFTRLLPRPSCLSKPF